MFFGWPTSGLTRQMKRMLPISVLSMLLGNTALAERYNPYSPEDPAYTKAMSNYGKEMLFAKYAARQRPDYKITYNPQHFEKGPPLLWDDTRYKNFLTVVMVEPKEKLNKRQSALGHDKFCQTAVEFIAANYKPSHKPVLIDGK